MELILNTGKLKLTGQETYDTYIQKFNREVGKANLETVKKWINSLKGELRPASIQTLKAGLKKSIQKTFSKESNYIPFLVALDQTFKEIKIDRPDKKVYSEEVLTEKEIDLLIQKSSTRTSLIIETLVKTGLRISELLNLTLADCKTESKFTFFRLVGKGGKERRVFIPNEIFTRIKKEYKGKKYLFETSKGNKIVRQYAWKEINRKGLSILGKEIHPHTFRHTFATNTILKKGKDLKAVSQYLGHSKTSTTADMYLHSQLEPKDLFS